MLGRTHITLGMASALILTQPTTVPGVITALAGGALGGWVVDVDLRNRNGEKDELRDRELIYDGIIDALFIGAFIVLDFFIGKGMCQYVIDNWGAVTLAGLLGFIILLLIGFNTKHRTFTHSFLGMALFSGSMSLFCLPAATPFFIGYASHIVADFFNKLGLQLFFPLKWKPCLKLCRSDKKANRVLFWISFGLTIIFGAYFFANALAITDFESSHFISNLVEDRFFGLNALQIYLIIINIITFLGFQRSARLADKREEEAENDKAVKIKLEFETWFLNFLVFIGGGVGMMISLIIHLRYPAAYNGNWWAFCYTSVLFWFTMYCYICNPFGLTIGEINWLSTKHSLVLVYLIGINAISALILYSMRKKRFDEFDLKHTLIFILGAMGGTLGAIPVVLFTHQERKYHYITLGFFIMMISQITFVLYMMIAGVL